MRGAVAEARGWTNVLTAVPLFAVLSRRHVAKIARAGRSVRFYDGTEIVHAGECGDTLYVVLDGGPRSATVVARGSVACFAIGRAAFAKVLRAEPAIAMAILTELAARLRGAAT